MTRKTPIQEISFGKPEKPELSIYAIASRTVSTISLDSGATEFTESYDEIYIPDERNPMEEGGACRPILEQEQSDAAFRSLVNECLAEWKSGHGPKVITPKMEALIAYMVVSSIKRYIEENKNAAKS